MLSTQCSVLVSLTLSRSLWVGGLSGPRGEPYALMHLSSFLSPSPVLFAMKEDNEKVPTLLTDYILKGESGPGLWEQKHPLGPPPPGLLLDTWNPHRSPPRASMPGQIGQGQGTQWTIVGRPSPLDVARRPEEEIPSPPSHQSDSTQKAAKPTKELL